MSGILHYGLVEAFPAHPFLRDNFAEWMIWKTMEDLLAGCRIRGDHEGRPGPYGGINSLSFHYAHSVTISGTG